ncbi:MAG: hypothetical protein ABSE73_20890 [Planctomycetota bacterium]
MVRRMFGVLGLSLLLLSGCGATSSKQDLLTKAQNCKTKEELQKALGKPDTFDSAEVPFLGPQEMWTYKASDGEVTFIISNGKVITRSTDFNRKKK